MINPEVSIIIVSYNQFQLLENCLRSCNEKIKNVLYEIIVVDNASNEGDVGLITNGFQNIKLIRNSKNFGFAKANNQGAKIARGQYLLFLNNDTIFIENSLKIVIEFVKSKKEDTIVGIKLLNKDRSMQESVYESTTLWNSFTENFFLYKLFPRAKFFNKYYQNYNDYKAPIQTGVVKGAFLFISKASFNKLNGFDERFYFYAEELDLCYRFGKEIGKIYYYPLTSIIHYGGATTDKVLWFKFRNQARAKIQFYQKHFRGIKFVLGISFHFLGLIFRFPLYLLGGIFTLKKSLMAKSYYFFRQILVYPRNLFVKK